MTVYAADMPSTLPPVLLIRRLAQHTLFTFLFGLRAVAVAIIWLAVLPWATVWTWRMYFTVGESTYVFSRLGTFRLLTRRCTSAWWISDRPRPDTTGPETSTYFYRVTVDTPVPPSSTFVGRLTAHPLWIALSADIFTGQIIASLIVLTFVAVFLLREWISQNARPGVFEDEDVLPEEAQPQAAPQVPRPAQQRQAQPNPLDEALAQRQIEALRAIDVLRAREGINGHIVGDERHHHGRSPIQRTRRKAKTKEENEDSLYPFDGKRAHNRRLLHSKGTSEENEEEVEKRSELERMKRRSFSRRVYAARLLGARRRAALTDNSPKQSPMNVDPAFDFTFKAELPQIGRRSNSEPWKKQPRSTDTEHSNAVTSPPTPIFPPVALERPRGSIPFSFDRLKTPSPLPSPVASAEEGSTNISGMDSDAGIKLSLSASLSQDKARRPPLPTTSVGPSASFVISPPRTPLDSPSLATYRAPEELEGVVSLSSLNGYFDREQKTENSENGEDSEAEDINGEERSMQGQMDQYFEEYDATSEHTSLEVMAYSDTEDGDEDHIERDENQSETDEESVDSDEDEDEANEEEANRLGLFNEDDWALEVQVVQQPAAVGLGEGVAAAAQEGVEAAQPPGGGVDPNEEVEGNVEDDMDGAMEGKSIFCYVLGIR
jgi:E3 ubiquitin-protein ligase MARCH6